MAANSGGRRWPAANPGARGGREREAELGTNSPRARPSVAFIERESIHDGQMTMPGHRGDNGSVCPSWCCEVDGENDRGHAVASPSRKGEKGGASGGQLGT
jgi:hypothetical protein